MQLKLVDWFHTRKRILIIMMMMMMMMKMRIMNKRRPAQERTEQRGVES